MRLILCKSIVYAYKITKGAGLMAQQLRVLIGHPGFSSQHHHGSLHPSVTPVPRDVMVPSGFFKN